MVIYSYPQRSVKGEKRTVLYGKNSIIVFRKKLGVGAGSALNLTYRGEKRSGRKKMEKDCSFTLIFWDSKGIGKN